MSPIISLICMFIIGTICAAYLLFLILKGDARIVAAEFDNILLRYSVAIALLNAAVFCVLMPIFAYFKLVPVDYWNSDSYERAKTNLISIFLILPGLILINLWAFYAEQKMIFILDIMVALAFFSSSKSIVDRGKDR